MSKSSYTPTTPHSTGDDDVNVALVAAHKSSFEPLIGSWEGEVFFYKMDGSSWGSLHSTLRLEWQDSGHTQLGYSQEIGLRKNDPSLNAFSAKGRALQIDEMTIIAALLSNDFDVVLTVGTGGAASGGSASRRVVGIATDQTTWCFQISYKTRISHNHHYFVDTDTRRILTSLVDEAGRAVLVCVHEYKRKRGAGQPSSRP